MQQALLQVLQEQWDPTFSEHSYGFRTGRSAHQAVAQAQCYIAEGYSYVVDLDLERFFDRVNHDSLMARVAARVSDKRVLKLIRAFLNARVMEDDLVRPVDEGTPQGGPLSPLVSNLLLDDLDRNDPTWSPLLPIRGRLQHLCSQLPRRRTGHGFLEPIPDQEAAAEG
ncbi:reverse transcriptase domain-containing protein [Mesorhizobium sp. M0510]|uniref:reverse transcriptase domain-containing protein n=1 Tax=Mesorhizobium sp. M0510 TaxID=2956954 RepID=UPI00333C62CA